MSDPLVSVIIPVYNSQHFLREAIDSALAQRYGSIQVIVVDDGSTDDSPGILRSYGEDLEVYFQENAGSAAARNHAISKARGEFIAFLDADDAWHPDKTRIQVDHLQRNIHIGIVYANLLFAGPKENDAIVDFLREPVDNSVEIDPTNSGWVYTKFLKESLLQTSSVIMRRSLKEKVGNFDIRLRKGQDYDYWIRVSRETEFHKLRPKLSVYRLHEQGITQQPSPNNYGAIVIETALARWGRSGPDGSLISNLEIRKRLGKLWSEFAYLHEKKGDVTVATRAYRKSLRYMPWRVRSMVKYFICHYRSRRGELDG